MCSMSSFSQTISNKTVYLFLEHKIGNGVFGESATNCSVNNKEGKKEKEQQTFTCSPDFLAAQHLTEVERCGSITGGLLHTCVSSCITFHKFLLKFLNK